MKIIFWFFQIFCKKYFFIEKFIGEASIIKDFRKNKKN